MGWREQQTSLQGTAVRTFSGGDDPDFFDYTAAGFAPVVGVSGIFRASHTYIDSKTMVQLSTEQPTLDVMLSDLPRAPKRDDIVEGNAASPRFAGQRWKVSNFEGDGEGMTKLFLIALP